MSTEAGFKKKVEYLSNDLPIAIHEVNSIYYHWHDEYEFIYARNHPAVCIVNGQQIVLEPGMGLVLQPGELHMLHMQHIQHMLDVPSTSSVYAIVVHPSFWATRKDAELFDGSLQFQNLLTPQFPQDQRVLELFERIVACYRSKDYGYEFVLRVLVSSVFAEMLAQHMYQMHDHSGKPNKSAFPALLAYVHQNYMHALSLESLVREFHYSKSYIIRLFHENTNMTPVEFIKRYRIEKAKERLADGTESVLEVAIECGFQNVSYFTRSFKKYTGVTPGAFRTQWHSRKGSDLRTTENITAL